MKKTVYILFVLFAFLLTPGCWDMRDVNNTAFVISLGIDAPPNPDTAKYLITFEFAKPLPINENTITGSTTASVEADSILQAIQRVQSRVSRSISLTHLRLLVAGEDIARKEAFRDIANYIVKEPEIALQIRLIFVQGASAQDVLNSQSYFEKRVAAELVAMGLLQKDLSLARNENFLDFLNDLQQTEGKAIASRVLIDQNNMLIRQGAAIFKDWKLESWLNADEAQAASWLLEQAEAVIVAKKGESIYTYQIQKHKTKIKPVFKEGKLSIIITTTTQGIVLEEAGRENLDLSKQENVKKIEDLFTKTILEQISSAIKKSQYDFKADYLELGQAVERYYPGYFNSINWQEVYPTVPIEVQVDCKVKGYGMQK